MVEIWLTEPYFREYRHRKGSLFHEAEKEELFGVTQLLQKNWPRCAKDPTVPPEVGTQAGLFYIKCDFSKSGAIFRVAFGHEQSRQGVSRLVALTCRTKQELAKGAKGGTKAWYQHIATTGRQRWMDYRRGFVRYWRIY